jgi:hypothetical protein
LPERLHGADPRFTPPFPESVVKLIGPESTFSRKHGEIHPLIAERNGVPVGRIAAVINRSHNAHSRDTVGFFGFFDCIDDVSVARSLFDAAAAILRARGLDSMRGPYNPSINDDCGILLEGNERPSFVSMPWNPPYYGALLRSAGLEQARTLYAWDIPLDRPIPDRINKIVERIRTRRNATIRTIDLANLERDLTIVHRLYNASLDRNWGFYPIDLDDLLHAAEDLKAIADPETIFFVCMDGKEVGFSLALPNVNEIFRAARGGKGVIRIIEIGLRLKLQRITSQRLCILGVEPAYRDKGLSALLFHESFRSSSRKYSLSEVSWVEANNEEILDAAEIMGGRRSRTYGIFETPIEDSLPEILRSEAIFLGPEIWANPHYDRFFRVLKATLRREGSVVTMSGRQFDELCRTQAPDSRALLRIEEFSREGLLVISRVDLHPGKDDVSEPGLPEQVLSLVDSGRIVTLLTDDAGLRIRLRSSAKGAGLRLAAGSDFLG